MPRHKILIQRDIRVGELRQDKLAILHRSEVETDPEMLQALVKLYYLFDISITELESLEAHEIERKPKAGSVHFDIKDVVDKLNDNPGGFGGGAGAGAGMGASVGATISPINNKSSEPAAHIVVSDIGIKINEEAFNPAWQQGAMRNGAFPNGFHS